MPPAKQLLSLEQRKEAWKHMSQRVPRLTSLNLSVPSFKMGLLGG